MKIEASPKSVVSLFTQRGAQCLQPAAELAARLAVIDGLIFDWDGVFNDGKKGGNGISGFSEADAMGTNMLRFGMWLGLQRLPVCALISGENNPAAVQFARREHFDAVYSAVRDKRLALDHLCDRHQLKSKQVACVFDDINDLAMARSCGLRFLVRRAASPLFTVFATDGGLCDYVTAASGGDHAVREISEMMLGLMNRFHAVAHSRIAFDASYAEYFSRRQDAATHFFRQEADRLVAAKDDSAQ